MRTRHLSTKELAAELRKATRHSRALDQRPWSLIMAAQELHQILEDQVWPAQEVADEWIAEQQKFARRIHWIAGLVINLPKRPPRAIHITDTNAI